MLKCHTFRLNACGQPSGQPVVRSHRCHSSFQVGFPLRMSNREQGFVVMFMVLLLLSETLVLFHAFANQQERAIAHFWAERGSRYCQYG